MRIDEVTIIGGGVIGLSLAWELTRRGVAVTVLERDRVGQATSWAAAGILPPACKIWSADPLDQLRSYSQRLYPDWIARLEQESDIDCQYERCGGWYLAETPGEHAAMIGVADYWNQQGIYADKVTSDHLAIREPQLAAWIRTGFGRAAWWVEEESQIRPPRLLAALQRACEKHGVRILQKCCIDGVRIDEGHVQLQVDGTRTSCGSVVICGGVWSGQIAHDFGLQQSLVPIRGQMLLFRTSDRLVRPVVNMGHRYVVCRQDGHVLVGSCEEEVGFQNDTTPQMIDPLRRFAFDVLPALRAAREVKAWSGLRPMTFDGFPMLGRVPGTDQVFVASGHFRSGIHLAPATAELMADLIQGQSTALSLDPFRVGKQQINANVAMG